MTKFKDTPIIVKIGIALILISIIISVVQIFTDKQEAEKAKSVMNTEKVILMSANLPKNLDMTSKDHYKLPIPYEAENITYSTDNSNVATITEDGNINVVGDGTCLAEIITDDIVYHMIINVSDTGKQFEGNDNMYAIYTANGFNAEMAVKELETYASSIYGMTIKDNLKEDTNLVETNAFTLIYEHSGIEVKYKLLSTLSSLDLSNYKNLDIEAQIDEEQIVFFFYATK